MMMATPPIARTLMGNTPKAARRTIAPMVEIAMGVKKGRSTKKNPLSTEVAMRSTGKEEGRMQSKQLAEAKMREADQ